MDHQTAGQVGGIIGIVGGVLGGLGGLFGTYVGIKKTNGPRERAFAIRAATLGLLGVAMFLACFFLVPMPGRFLLWGVYVPSLIFFSRRWNERQVRARAEDLGENP